jgi:proteic killer suppression protein
MTWTRREITRSAMKGTLYNIPLSDALTQVNGGPDDHLVPECLVARLFVEDAHAKRIPANLEACLFRRLQILDDARTDADLRVPPSNHFEKLKGALGGWHSIRVNEQWRLVFRWHGGRGEASDVHLDNHSYR